MRESTIHREASSSFCSAQTSEQGPPYPTLRANPFPEVTDLFCRLPLPTLFYRPEAANLGDLMRLWVRPGVWISLSFGFSRVVESTPDTSEDKVLYPPFNPISRQSDFRVKGSLKEKTTLPKAPSLRHRILLRCHTVSTSWLGNINPVPCREAKQSLRVQNIPVS